MSDRFISATTEEELAYVAALDYGQDSEKHLAQLRAVVREQKGRFRENQRWHPYEVVELGSHALARGHEREFVLCTLLVIQAVVSGFDSATNLGEKFDDRAADYDLLPGELRNEVLDAYRVVDC